MLLDIFRPILRYLLNIFRAQRSSNREARSSVNISAPIDRLPIELLVDVIFKDVLVSERQGLGGRPSLRWMKLLRVCRHWRKAVESKTTWWNDVDIIHPDATKFMLQFMLDRSMEPRFRLRLERGEPREKTRRLLDVVHESALHLSSLKLDLSAEVWVRIFNEQTTWSLDVLKHLTVRTQRPLTGTQISSTVLPFVVPALKSLHASEIHLTALCPILPPSLEELCVYGTAAVKANVIKSVLETVRGLRTLTLSVDVVDDGTWTVMDQARREIELPRLKDLYLLARDPGILDLFSRLGGCLRASTTLDLQCDTITDAQVFVQRGFKQIEEMAKHSSYRHCELSHGNVQHTRVTLGCDAELLDSSSRLRMIFEGYPEDAEEDLYGAISQSLSAVLSPVKHLRIRDMQSYDEEGLPSCRDLIGPFPTGLFGAFGKLETLDMENVRFRRTFREDSPGDFHSVLKKFLQRLLPENRVKELTIRRAINLHDYDVEHLRSIITNRCVVWDGAVEEEDGGSDDDE